VPFCPDDFVLGLTNMLSNGSLSSGQPFDELHPDPLREAYCVRNRADRKGRADTEPGTLQVLETLVLDPTELDGGLEYLQQTPHWPFPDLPPEAPHPPTKLVVIRTWVSESVQQADDQDDAARWYLLPGTQYRLFTQIHSKDGDSARPGHNYWPLGYLTWRKEERTGHRKKLLVRQGYRVIPAPESDTGDPEIARLCVARKHMKDIQANPVDNSGLVVDWIYRVRADELPWYMAFRRVAKAQIKSVETDVAAIRGKIGDHNEAWQGDYSTAPKAMPLWRGTVEEAKDGQR
jgi:hypothetical protein